MELYPERGVEYTWAMEQTTWLQYSRPEVLDQGIQIGARFWSLANGFQRINTTVKYVFPFHSVTEELDINSLPIFPLRFAKSGVKHALKKRGKMVWKLRTRAYMYYSGLLAGSREFAVSIFISTTWLQSLTRFP